ncbi:DUF1735 domain-containing protein [Flaviaesturariibacter aridisoli]|uniref:DUF1735 domain-containing protein n=1 Tax=Flaviaesturariibacter aridisoli TaxID=2545761 RepID=A0A4R4E5U1_9BACT|nr:DUF1735 domain-containing protein [Flaviaesturariibacter aridisoli]TCZ75026.1 DUF1735 domain-containing protein [Flaviaesturariibacter aridisoli]
MKRYFVNTALALTGFLALGLTSCLKDKEFEDGSIQSVHNGGDEIKVIELGVAGTSSTATSEGGSSIVYGLNAANSDTTFALVPVILATSSPAEEDIHVTLAAAPELVDSFNNFNGTAAQVPTSTMYTILNAGNVVTIPRGSNVGYLQVKLNPNNFLGQDWALAYKIVSVDRPGYVISSNNRTALTLITIKNRYDGAYRLTLRASGWEPFGISSMQGTYPGLYAMETSGVASVDGNALARGDYLLPAFGGDATSITSNTAFGAVTPRFTFDLATNRLTSVSNSTPPDSRNRILTLLTTAPASSVNIFPAGVTLNSWDPNTGNIYAYFKLGQTGRPDLLYQAIYTYVRPR